MLIFILLISTPHIPLINSLINIFNTLHPGNILGKFYIFPVKFFFIAFLILLSTSQCAPGSVLAVILRVKPPLASSVIPSTLGFQL